MLEIAAETVGETETLSHSKRCRVAVVRFVDTRVADTSYACSTAVRMDDTERESRGTPLRPGIWGPGLDGVSLRQLHTFRSV